MTRAALVPRIVLAFALCLAAVPVAAQDFEGAEFQKRRQEYLDGPRMYPGGLSPDEAVIRARLAMKASARLASSFFAGAAGGSWLPVGPGAFTGADGFFTSSPQMDAGRVDYIALHPTSPSTMLLASPQGGVWRTQTGGDSWAPLTDNECSMRMGAVRYDPVNPNIVYAALAASSGFSLCGMLRSADGGNTWTPINGGFSSITNGGTDIYVDPATAGSTTATTVLVAGPNGFLRTTTSGNVWTFQSIGRVNSIVALPGASGVLFAGIARTSTPALSGLYRSTDKGATWTQVSSGTLDLTNAGRFQLAVSPADPTSVWILVGGRDSKFLALAKWDDASGVMTSVAASGLATGSRGSFGSQATYDLVLAVDPVNAGLVYVAGVRMYRSTNGGATFAQIANEIHCDWHYLAIDPRDSRRLYAGTDGGVFTSLDGGNNWVSRSRGLSIAMIYPGISQHPTNRLQVSAGLQDNGTILSDGTSVWSGLSGGDGGYTAINYANPSVMWSEAQWTVGSGPAIYRSTVVGSPRSRRVGIAITDRAQFIPPLVMDPVVPTKLYFGTHLLYRTVDDGANWTPVSGDLTKGTGSIYSIAIAPSDSLTIYVGTSDGNVQVSRDHGVTFTLISATLPARVVTKIAIDATDPKRAIVTLSGTGGGHAYLTKDAGLTWTNVTGTLPDVPTTSVVMINDGQNHFFVGNDLGVYETTDAGATWARSPSGLPNVQVTDLSFSATTQQLVAATYGRGMFTYALGNQLAVLRGDVNRDGKVDAFDALLIQQALLGLSLAGGFTSLPHGDTNCNGVLEASDLLITLRAAVGLTSAGACVGTIR